MGGLGSGGHNNKGRALIEEQVRLDAGQLKRSGVYAVDYCGRLTWQSSGRTPGFSARILGGTENIQLEYAAKIPGGVWQRCKENIPLLTCLRNYGGAQTYFGCPKCGLRVKYLFYGSQRFLCRHCLDLVYASSQEGLSDRAMRRVRKMRRHIGADMDLTKPVGQKPVGMHWHTYNRILRQIRAAEAEMKDGLIRILNQLTKFRSDEAAQTKSHAPSFWRGI